MSDALALPPAQRRLAWLRSKINDDIGRLKEKRHRFQRYAAIVQLATIILSGLVSILLGIDLYEANLKRVAFVLGVIVTVLNAIEPFFNFRALWIAHEDAKYRMHRLQDTVECYAQGVSADDADPKKIEEFERERHAIWDWVSAEWLARRRANGDKKDA